MSVSSVKQRLIKEVVSAYYEAQKEDRKSRSSRWNLILGSKLRALGWRVDHPGSDKYVAIKGSLVCKWVGHRGWSQNAIKDMAGIRRRLGHAGLGKYLPLTKIDFLRFRA